MGLSGISNNTANRLTAYSSGYKESSNVTLAKQKLEQLKNNKTSALSSYENQLNDFANQIYNRPEFKYDLNNDALWKNAKDQYVSQGKMAMENSMGQAAQLTGGYGNSYAASVGQQTFNNYLNQLNSLIPDYYNMARSNYDSDTQNLMNKYNVSSDRYNTKLSDYNNDIALAGNEYDTERNYDTNSYNTMLNYWQNQAQAENSDYWQKKNDELARQQFAEQVRANKANEEYNKATLNYKSSSSSSSGSKSIPSYILKKCGTFKDNNSLASYLDGLEASGSISSQQKYELAITYGVDDEIASSGKKSILDRDWTLVSNGGVNWFGGLDNNGIVKDEQGNKYNMTKLAEALAKEDGYNTKTAKKKILEFQKNMGITK